MIEKNIENTWMTFLDAQKNEIVKAYIEFLNKDKDLKDVKDNLIYFIKRYKGAGFRESKLEKLKPIVLADFLIASINMSKDKISKPNMISGICRFYYLEYDKKILPTFLDLLKIEHNGNGLINGVEKNNALNERAKNLTFEEVNAAIKTLEKNHSKIEIFGLLNALYYVMPVWEFLGPCLSDLDSKINNRSNETVNEKILQKETNEPLSSKITFLDKLIISSIVASVNDEPGSHTYEELYEIVDELITLNSRPDCHYHYEHMGFLDSLYNKEINHLYTEKNNSNVYRKKYYLYGYLSGLMRDIEKSKTKIMDTFENYKKVICIASDNTSDERILSIQQKLFFLLLEENKIKDAGNLLSKNNFNTKTDRNERFVIRIMNKLKGWLLREKLEEVKQLISCLEDLKFIDLHNEYQIRINYYRARTYQLSGNFSKAISIYTELSALENEYKYVYLTEMALCHLSYKDVRYIEFPDSEEKFKDFYNRLSSQVEHFKEAIRISPEKATNAYLTMGIILLAKHSSDVLTDCSKYFDMALEKITTTYYEEYRALEIDNDFLFLSSIAHSVEKKARLCLAVSEAEKLDDHLILKIRDNIEKVATSEKHFSLALWSRLIDALDALGETSFVANLYDSVAKGKMKNKEEVLNLFKNGNLTSSEEFAKRQLQKIHKINNHVEKMNSLNEFINNFHGDQSSLAAEAIDAIEEIVSLNESPNLENTSAFLTLLRDKTNSINVIYSRQDFLQLMIKSLCAHNDLAMHDELESCYKLLVDHLLQNNETYSQAEEWLEEMEEAFPMNQEGHYDRDAYYNNIRRTVGIKSEDSNETSIRNYNGKIHISFFGGSVRHRDTLNSALEKLNEKYQNKICVVGEPIFIYENSSSKWGRLLESSKSMILDSDIVIINTDIRTNFGGHLREMAGNKWSSCSRPGQGIYTRVIEKACAKFIASKVKEESNVINLKPKEKKAA